MSDYKYVEQVLAKIEDREQIHGLVEPKVPKPSKYRMRKGDKKARPDLRVGKKLVFSIGRRHPRGIAAYGLAVILDWHDYSEHDYWGNAKVIVQVTRVSKPEFEGMVGRLRHLDVYGWNWATDHMPMFAPEECDPKDYGL